MREIVGGRVHKFPCDCGACVYRMYLRGGKTKGRTFSARTFFVFFLRTDLFEKVWAESMPLDWEKMKRDADDATGGSRLAGRFARERSLPRLPWKHPTVSPRDRGKPSPLILALDVYHANFRKAAKSETMTMIKELARRERTPAASKFLRGILVRKSFYTYYSRADDERLRSIVQKARRDLATTVDREAWTT